MKPAAPRDFTVVLNTAPSGNVTVTITNPDTGAVGVEFAPDNATSLTFTTTNLGDSAGPWTVSAVDDDDVGDESVTLTVSASGANYGGVASRTVKVAVDGRRRPVTLQSSIPLPDPGVMVTENSSATYTVSLSHGPNADVTVSLASDDDRGLRR